MYREHANNRQELYSLPLGVLIKTVGFLEGDSATSKQNKKEFYPSATPQPSTAQKKKMLRRSFPLVPPPTRMTKSAEFLFAANNSKPACISNSSRNVKGIFRKHIEM